MGVLNRRLQNNPNVQTSSFTRTLQCYNCGEKGHKQHQCPKPKRMLNQKREGLANVHQTQKVTRNHYQASPTVIKETRLQQNNTSLIGNDKVCGRNCQMVVDTGTCFIIVRPDIVKHCRISDTGAKFILETVGGDTMPVLAIYEAQIEFGQHESNHLVLLYYEET